MVYRVYSVYYSKHSLDLRQTRAQLDLSMFENASVGVLSNLVHRGSGNY